MIFFGRQLRVPFLALLATLAGCSRDLELPQAPVVASGVVVEAIEPARGFAGQLMRIRGSGFAAAAEENQVLFASTSTHAEALDPLDGALLVRIPDGAGHGAVSVATPVARSPPGPEFEFLGFGRPRVGAITQRQRLLHRPTALAGLGGTPVFLSPTTRSLHGDFARLDLAEDVTAVLGRPDGSVLVASCRRALGGCDLERPAYTLWRWSPGAPGAERLLAQEGTTVWQLLPGRQGDPEQLLALTGIEGRRDEKLVTFTLDPAGASATQLTSVTLPADSEHRASTADGTVVLGVGRASQLERPTLFVIDPLTGETRRPKLAGSPPRPIEVFGPILAADLGPDPGGGPTAFASVGDGWLVRFRLDRLDELEEGTEPERRVDLVNRASPGGLAIAPQDGLLAASRPETGRLSLVDLATDRVLASIPAGIEPRVVAYDEPARRFYVADDGENAIEVVDAVGRTSVARASTRFGLDASRSAYVVLGNLHLIAVAAYWVDAALALDGRSLAVIGPFGRSLGVDALLPGDESSAWLSGRFGIGRVGLQSGVVTPLLPPPCEGMAWESTVVDAQGQLWATHSRIASCGDGATVPSRLVRLAADGAVVERELPAEAVGGLVASGDGVVALVLPDGLEVYLERFTAASLAAGSEPVASWHTESSHEAYFAGMLPFGDRIAAFFSGGTGGEPPEVAWLDASLVEVARVDSDFDALPAVTLPDAAHFLMTSYDGQSVSLHEMEGDRPARLLSTPVGGTASGLLVSPSGDRIVVPIRETDELVVIE